MKSIDLKLRWPWVGIVGGACCWASVHQIGVYFSDASCGARILYPSVQGTGLGGSLLCAWLSWMSFRAERPGTSRSFLAALGIGAACLFSLVIFWQLVATLVYTDCAR